MWRPGSAIPATNFLAPRFDLFSDFVPDFSDTGHFLVVRAGERGRIAETPVKTFGHAGKNRTTLGAGFIANGDHVAKKLARLEEVENSARFLLRNIDARFPHRFNHERIQNARFEAGAFRREKIAADLIQPSLGHLAAGAVVNADEQDIRFHQVAIAS
jgi:hypothetical protein